MLGILMQPNSGRFVRASSIPFFILLLPLIEIAGFIIVGRQIGVFPTLALAVATSIAGGMLLKHQGFGVMTRIRNEVAAGRDPSRELAHGVMVLLAGILLLLPGFFTDIIGILLFLPPVRDLGWNFLRRRVDFTVDYGGMGGFSRKSGRGKTIDLDEEDYSRRPGPQNPHSPWKQIGDE
ncbi:membrane protein FxsA [Mesorhizobium soli]|uniref:Membrane protein FxsA n=2 Tax=Pseudaminobacter soli (ex Li et al. 2025) TaxID=1295366 RepID=A0A2P7SI24_9HYPH|nr:membrane protein FxsA [Mesorhizobium soli]